MSGISTVLTLSTVDYVVMGLLLALSASIGIYYAIKMRNSQTTEEYLMAGKNMNPIPVALSLLASFMSAVTLMGAPAEIYMFGTQFFLLVIAFVMVVVAAAYFYIPVFHRVNATSTFEYLELRFGKSVRIVASVIAILQTIFYLAIVLYAPSLALSAVTGLSEVLSIILIGLVCTFYTTIGGMKAVVWTDALQIILMFISIFALLGEGLVNVNNEEIISRNVDGQRFEFFNFNPSPLERHTVWTVIFGGFLTWLAVYGVNQAQVQRCLTVSSLKKAQVSMLINGVGLVLLYITLGFVGLIMYAYYYKCDPLSSKKVSASDQLTPYFMMEILGKYSGLPGLFVSGLFSGSLSTISSGVNSLSAVILEDFVKGYIWPKISEIQATRLSKILALIFGLMCIGMAFIASLLGNILQAAFSIFGMLGGPLLGVFTLGMFFPWANTKGAFVGLLSGLAIILWVGVGAAIYATPPRILPLMTSGCLDYNITKFNETTTVLSTYLSSNATLQATASTIQSGSSLSIYRLSYLWYSGFSSLIVIIVGHIITFFTGRVKGRDLDPKLVFPLFYKLGFFLPKTMRGKLIYGIHYKGEYGIHSTEENFSSCKGLVNAGFISDLDSNFSLNEKGISTISSTNNFRSNNDLIDSYKKIQIDSF